ncbi:MAG TPA: hypothetical protein ENK91_11330 [Bacteroidetes bacterium]|nr:hypothetical protein [Bacteroidota bacterium]
MLSLKDFKDFSLSKRQTENSIGGNTIIGILHETDTGKFNEVWEFDDNNNVVRHEFYDMKGNPYDGKQGEK